MKAYRLFTRPALVASLVSLTALFPMPSEAQLGDVDADQTLFVKLIPDGTGPRVLPAGQQPDDARLKPLKDLNGYFPFEVPKSKAVWEKRAEEVRRQILVSEGLWPMPTKTPLNAVVSGKTETPEYTIENVFFESHPGFFVTGNLYRPKNVKGKVPAVMFAHGHWRNARLSYSSEEELRKEIATGQERFENGGRSRFQSMCVQLARMGCVVWQWDMLGDSDSHQLSHELVHRFAKQRPEMNSAKDWGFFSPQAESRMQSVMGLQTWNSIRSLDYLLTLPEVDPARIAITGASGGGTQTMLLAAVDDRVALSFPAVMVSTAMQGGCTCENASLLRVNTGNIEFSAMMAPKPQGMTCANDWTKEMSTKGFPEIQQLYKLMGAPNNVMLSRGEHFPHNYNAVSRSAFETWLNKHFKLGFKEPVIERDYEPVALEKLSVWNAQHPEPPGGDAFERKLVKYLTESSDAQIRGLRSHPAEYRRVVGGAVESIIGRSFAKAGQTEFEMKDKNDRGSWLEMTGSLKNITYSETLPVVFLHPKNWNGRTVLWIDGAGKNALYAKGKPRAEVATLLKDGATVIGVDLLYQGEFQKDSNLLKRTEIVANPREFAGYTFGYNSTVFAKRVHDVLSLVAYVKASDKSTKEIDLLGVNGGGVIALAARALAGDSVKRAAVDTEGFRFANLDDFRHPNYLVGAAKYDDVPGLVALNAPLDTWVAGEITSGLEAAKAVSKALPQLSKATQAKAASEAVKWLRSK